MREWASWQIEQEYFIDSNFGGAVIPARRNVFESTLDLTGGHLPDLATQSFAHHFAIAT